MPDGTIQNLDARWLPGKPMTDLRQGKPVLGMRLTERQRIEKGES